VLPNTVAPFLIIMSSMFGTAILTEAGLSFLGLGAPPPTPSWGAMINEGARELEIAPWIATFPGLALSVVVLAFALLGDALRDHLDPRLRGR
jgi:peptide/nickel transport system permease protein